MQTIQPTRNFLFCKKYIEDEVLSGGVKKLKSGILMHSKVMGEDNIAEVINCGPEVKYIKSKDMILFKSYGVNEFKLNNEDYLLISEDDVLGKILEV